MHFTRYCFLHSTLVRQDASGKLRILLYPRSYEKRNNPGMSYTYVRNECLSTICSFIEDSPHLSWSSHVCASISIESARWADTAGHIVNGISCRVLCVRSTGVSSIQISLASAVFLRTRQAIIAVKYEMESAVFGIQHANKSIYSLQCTTSATSQSQSFASSSSASAAAHLDAPSPSKKLEVVVTVMVGCRLLVVLVIGCARVRVHVAVF